LFVDDFLNSVLTFSNSVSDLNLAISSLDSILAFSFSKSNCALKISVSVFSPAIFSFEIVSASFCLISANINSFGSRGACA
jgi:hypothetical protein